MCAVTLTVVPACSHELPTIGYCFNAEPEVHSYEAKLKTGEQVQPPKTCTESLGGMLYEALNAPVSCASCKAWLLKAGKRTSGGVEGAGIAIATAGNAANLRNDGEAAARREGEEDDGEDLTRLLKHGQRPRPPGHVIRD